MEVPRDDETENSQTILSVSFEFPSKYCLIHSTFSPLPEMCSFVLGRKRPLSGLTWW